MFLLIKKKVLSAGRTLEDCSATVSRWSLVPVFGPSCGMVSSTFRCLWGRDACCGFEMVVAFA